MHSPFLIIILLPIAEFVNTKHICLSYKNKETF